MPTERRTIIIIDDEPQKVRGLARMIEKMPGLNADVLVLDDVKSIVTLKPFFESQKRMGSPVAVVISDLALGNDRFEGETQHGGYNALSNAKACAEELGQRVYTMLTTSWGDAKGTDKIDIVLPKRSTVAQMLSSIEAGLHYARTGQYSVHQL
jgi:hypothetical protein